MKRKSKNTHQRIRKTNSYPLFAELISKWKPRAKRCKYKLKDLAKDSSISQVHMTRLVTGFCDNPTIETINAVEMALLEAEKKAGVR